MQIKQAKKLIRASLYFTDEVNRSRLVAKVDKDLRIFDEEEYCDFDFVLSLILDEYFATKKRICGMLSRSFSRKFEENQGFFSIDEVKELFLELAYIYKAGDDSAAGFPIRSDLQSNKLYLYAATAGKNGYELNLNHFLTSVQRYGFDAPFPFLHHCPKIKKHKEESQQLKREQATPSESQKGR